PDQAQFLQRPEYVPVKVNLIPPEAMAGYLRVGVMVVVPAFAEAQDRYPEAVPRTVTGEKAARAPHVSGGIYEPGRVQAHNRPQEDAPHHPGESPSCQKYQAESGCGDPVPFADPAVEFILAEIGDIRQKLWSMID